MWYMCGKMMRANLCKAFHLKFMQSAVLNENLLQAPSNQKYLNQSTKVPQLTIQSR